MQEDLDQRGSPTSMLLDLVGHKKKVVSFMKRDCFSSLAPQKERE